jgi:hypothetical protein
MEKDNMKHLAIRHLIIAMALSGATLARAQDAPMDEEVDGPDWQAAEEEAPAPTAPEGHIKLASSEEGADGGRFRFGISGGLGFFTATPENGTGEASFTYGGIDMRFGWQINDLVGVYAQPTLGYYSTGDGGFLGVGGLLGLAVAADVTLMDRFFAGAGLGYTIYNNPAGLTPLLRIGAYPLMSRSAEKVRRKGLMLGVDLRFTKLEALKTIVMPTFNVGYEAF